LHSGNFAEVSCGQLPHLVEDTHIFTAGILRRINTTDGNSHFVRSLRDAAGNLASIRNEQLLITLSLTLIL
jgi:hypothetical protein